MGIFKRKQETGRAAIRRAKWQLRRTFALVGGFSMFANLLMLAAPLYMLQVYDRVLVSHSHETLFYLTLIALAAFATYAAVDYVRSRLLVVTAGWADRFLRDAAFEADLKARQVGQTAPGRMMNAVTTLRATLSGSGISPLMDTPWTPIFIAALFLLHPMLGWIVVAGALTLLALALLNDMASSGAIKRSERSSAEGQLLASEALRAADSVNAMGFAAGLRMRLRAINEEATGDMNRASVRGGFLSAISRFVRYGLQIAVLGAGALLVLGGEISGGAIIAASILSGRALAPVDKVISSWRSIIAARQAFATIKTDLSNGEQETTKTSLPRPAGRLDVEDVNYTPANSAKPVLQKITFNVQPGECLGLAGPTGSGKTTLARILAGSMAPTSGHARLDGADVARWEASDRGRHVGYVPQVADLIPGTVRDNIARFSDADDSAVVRAAQKAGAHETILALPEGYDTVVGPTGINLSGGQRQQIALARALYGDPAILILDEPNANLDTEGRERLLVLLGDLKTSGTTCIVISHRSDVLHCADRLLVLRDGEKFSFGPTAGVLRNTVAKLKDKGEVA